MAGGIERDAVAAARKAGCNVLVAASAIFESKDQVATIAALR